MVNSNNIHVDPSKIEVVKNWKAPKTPSEMRSFLGLAGYYRRFIANFSKIAKPLTSLTQKNKKYEWGVEQEEAFQTLKDSLCNAPILSLPDEAKDFEVYCDVSNQGLGCVLMQRGKSSLKEKLLADQNEAIKEENAPAEMLRGLDQQMKKKGDGGLYYMDRIWVPLIGDTRTMIIGEAHATRYSIHPGADKMYYDLRDMYWWPGMKKDIATYKALGTQLDMSTAYHPQMDGQSERTIQTLEDMLRACTINSSGSWDTHIPLAEFSYNNSYHTSIRCATFESLYARKFRSPVLWAKVGETRLIGLKMVQVTTDKVVLIKERLKAARGHQKSYADNRRKPLEFEEGDHVLLKVSPWKGVVRFRKKDRQNPRFVEEPAKIMDHEVKRLKRSMIPIVKVHWNSKRGPAFTWEREDFMKAKYLNLFADRVDESTS
ncbi:putative reverse transcriptase domain-containing protein [Tanacetum coccineum]|uniref:Reverse transcriptase domain-containing protein n=1 Tax=Tanacetum coccineum TaxID=301880 RepID=A0ABQ4X3N7_9ASTR